MQVSRLLPVDGDRDRGAVAQYGEVVVEDDLDLRGRLESVVVDVAASDAAEVLLPGSRLAARGDDPEVRRVEFLRRPPLDQRL